MLFLLKIWIKTFPPLFFFVLCNMYCSIQTVKIFWDLETWMTQNWILESNFLSQDIKEIMTSNKINKIRWLVGRYTNFIIQMLIDKHLHTGQRKHEWEAMSYCSFWSVANSQSFGQQILSLGSIFRRNIC